MNDIEPQTATKLLKSHWLSHKFKKSRIDNIITELAEAKRDLAKGAETARLDITRLIAAGDTTGDPLEDELVSWPGLNDEKAFTAFVDFSRKLVEAKGRELLLICRYKIQRCWRELCEPRNEDFIDRCGYVLGILSGERVRISSSLHETISLPFEKHFAWGWKGQRESGQTVIGALELESFIEPSVHAFRDFVIGDRPKTATLPTNASVKEQMKLFILIGDEIMEEALRHSKSGLTLKDLETVRKGLYAPTEAEKALAEAI
jgi:hypothetical protein